MVVIDELGRGTSTCDGIALSRAISQYLANNIGCFTFFATHFHELGLMSSEFPQVISNLHVAVKESEREDEDEGVVLMFKVREGVCDRSYGIHVARVVGFPEVVIKMAQWRADLLEGSRPAELCKEEVKFLNLNDENVDVPITLKKYF